MFVEKHRIYLQKFSIEAQGGPQVGPGVRAVAWQCSRISGLVDGASGMNE